jgi:hypothetical protein
MFHNQRKSFRRRVNWEAAIIAVDGTWQHKCTIVDVSASGAQLSLNPEISIPREFFLSFTGNGRVYRPCELIWRTDEKLGVRFTRVLY